MTESDYSINPLPNLPNVSGVNPPGGSEDQRKRRNGRERSPQKAEPGQTPSEQEESGGSVFNPELQIDSDDEHIDYCA